MYTFKEETTAMDQGMMFGIEFEFISWPFNTYYIHMYIERFEVADFWIESLPLFIHEVTTKLNDVHNTGGIFHFKDPT
jgi:hypothetical protein